MSFTDFHIQQIKIYEKHLLKITKSKEMYNNSFIFKREFYFKFKFYLNSIHFKIKLRKQNI